MMMFRPTQPAFATAALCLTLAGAGRAGLIAHYSFDTDFTDSSASANDLSVGGGVPSITTTAGEFAFGGGALDLEKSSNEFMALTSSIGFSTSDSWTVSFWAKRRSGTAAATGMVLGDNTTTDSFIWLPDNPSVVQGMRFRPAGVGTSFNADYATGHDSDYHHWVVIADGSGDIRVYRDNSDLGTKTITGGTDFNIKTIGSGYTGTNQIFDGQLDEIYIFDEAIDAQTVESLFTSNVVPEPGSLALIGLGGVFAMTRRRR